MQDRPLSRPFPSLYEKKTNLKREDMMKKILLIIVVLIISQSVGCKEITRNDNGRYQFHDLDSAISVMDTKIGLLYILHPANETTGQEARITIVDLVNKKVENRKLDYMKDIGVTEPNPKG
jgi:hypothetical protein